MDLHNIEIDDYNVGLMEQPGLPGKKGAITNSVARKQPGKLDKDVRRRSVKGKRPAVKGVKPSLPHYNLVVWRQSR